MTSHLTLSPLHPTPCYVLQLPIDEYGLIYGPPAAAGAEALLARPSDLLRKQEAAVLWGKRQELLQDGRALVKLLRAVQAYGPFKKGVDGAGLVGMWAAAGCMLTVLDAMQLLGRSVGVG